MTGIITGVIILLIFIFVLLSYVRMELIINASMTNQFRVNLVFNLFFNIVDQHYLLDMDIILKLLDSYLNDFSDCKKTHPNWLRHYQNKLNYTQKEINLFKYYLKRSIIDQLIWKTTLGLGEADKTGYYSGALWAIKGMCLSILSQKSHINNLQININPDFVNSCFTSQFNCILKIRIVHIICISISILISKLRRYYNGIRSTPTRTETSHRGFDENCYG